MTADFKFIPAIAEGHLNGLLKGETLGSKTLSWWNDNSPFIVDGALLSAYYLYMRKGDDFTNFRNEINFPKDKLFILDSGGFELESQHNTTDPSHINVQKNLTPERIIKIQEANADIGLVLDRPPYKKVIKPNKILWLSDPDFFKSSMEFTAKNTEIALQVRTNSNLKLYGVLQGEQYEEVTEWYERMKKYPVDGWAVVPTPKSDFNKTAMYISFLLENNITIPIHFLGISGFNSLALIIYLLRKDIHGVPYYDSLLTSDSTSYTTGAKNRSYTLPGDFRSNITIGRINNIQENNIYGDPTIISKKNSQSIPLRYLPCECPICQLSSVDEMRAATNVGSMAVSLHNLYHQKAMVRVLTALVSSPDTYINYVLSYNKPTTSQQMDELFKLIDNIILYKRGHINTPFSWNAKHGQINKTHTDMDMFT